MIAITCKLRENQKKGDIKRYRREGFIPFVLYSKGKASEIGIVVKSEIEAALRNMQSGFLPTTVFSLQTEQGQMRKAIVREVQYAPATYEILHMDFMEIYDDNLIEVKIPIELTNTVDCVGVKLGGFLQSVMRHVRVRCVPQKMPSHFQVDVKDLGIYQSKRVSDMRLPDGVLSLEHPGSVLVTVSKK